jgi:SSS family solute:Na+ symporter
VLRLTHLHFLYVAPILTSVDVAILVGVSLCTRKAGYIDGELTMWNPDFRRSERLRLKGVPLWQDYRAQAAALLALTALVVIAFR